MRKEMEAQEIREAREILSNSGEILTSIYNWGRMPQTLHHLRHQPKSIRKA
jgi:hypothetical protein